MTIAQTDPVVSVFLKPEHGVLSFVFNTLEHMPDVVHKEVRPNGHIFALMSQDTANYYRPKVNPLVRKMRVGKTCVVPALTA